MEPRIVVIGAGSITHGRRLLNDLFTFSWMDHATLVLMAPHVERLSVVARYAGHVVEHEALHTRIEETTDLVEALDGADAVILLYDAGGFSAFDRDFGITRAFDIDLCVGDTMGPTGLMKGIRNVSVLRKIADVIRQRCADAVVISYVNPMAVMTMSAQRFGLKNFVGICGGVEATKQTIATCLEEPAEELDTLFAGINHMTWALQIDKKGNDLYPRLKERMTTTSWRAKEPVRAEVLHHFGYFVTETSGHLSDFFPWFRRDTSTRTRYCSGAGYSGATGAYHRYASYLHQRLSHVDYLAYETGELDSRSSDYGPHIVHAWLTGREYEFYGNLPNNERMIENLPSESAVEVPTTVKGGRLKGHLVGSLPPRPAALCETNITVQKLAVEAAITADPHLLLAAISMDPLTSASIDLPSARSLTERLISANAAYFSGIARDYTFGEIDAPSDTGVAAAAGPTSGGDLLDPVRRYDRKKRASEQGQQRYPS